MLHENAQVFSVDNYGEQQPFDGERWKAIRNRLIDELAKGGNTLEDFAPDKIEPGSPWR